MSLLDLLRPQWKHSDVRVRLKAVQTLSLENQDIFAQIALHDLALDIRRIAAKKLTRMVELRQLMEDSDAEIRMIARNKIQDEVAKIVRAHQGNLNAEIRQLIQDLQGSSLVDDLVRHAQSVEVRQALIALVSKMNVLTQVALRDEDEKVALDALNKVEREGMLQDIADHSRHPVLRSEAQKKIKKLFPSKPQEDPTLPAKREALISQLQRLLDHRHLQGSEEEFEQVVREAGAIDLGPRQTDFERRVEEFQQRLKTELDALQKQRAEAEALTEKREALEELVDALEAMVNDGSVSDRATELDELKDRWDRLNGDDYSEFRRRFDASIARAQRRLEEQEEDRQNLERMEDLRREIIQQLQHLQGKDDLSSVGRQLRGLVREWEQLPLTENDDPLLQQFNSLRDQLQDKMKSLHEEKRRDYEERSQKLSALIQRIKEIDENQDFREISKYLHQTYLEWKEIVGEDKFQFQDLWKEYRAASARFDEMKEWESWRNEQEREQIIQSLGELIHLSDAAEAIQRMRQLQQSWKKAGFVPQPRLQELWDQYKEALDRVNESFADYLNELDTQRQASLEKKLALCDEVERIVADESDEWKEKAHRIHEIQNEWKEVGPVPRDRNREIWDRFRKSCDAFYREHKKYLAQEDEARQDNLKIKQDLIVKAEALRDSEDWNGTTRRLRKLQEDWKKSGPVPKSQSEEVWSQFRAACDTFFDRKRAHFEEIDREKDENYAQKISLCEELERMQLDPAAPESVQTMEEFETRWAKIGMVPKEKVDEIWTRYCACTDVFLDQRAALDPALKIELQRRLEIKRNMLTRVRELVDDSGSLQASDEVRQLQEEWKSLGRTGSQEQELYKEFRKICDEFFERRRDQLDIQEQARQNNLQKKMLLIEQAERLLEDPELNEESLNEVKHLRRLWREVGSVPRNESDKIWKRFNQACDTAFSRVRGERPSEP